MGKKKREAAVIHHKDIGWGRGLTLDEVMDIIDGEGVSNANLIALPGVQAVFYLPDSIRHEVGATFEALSLSKDLFVMAHEFDVYVSATIQQLRDVIDGCEACGNRKVVIQHDH